MNEISPEESEAIIEAAAKGETLGSHGQLGEMLTSLHAPVESIGTAPSLGSPATGVTARMARRTAVAASVAVIGLAGVAAAATGTLDILGGEDPISVEAEEDDTLFNFGYDEELQLFVWNTTPTDEVSDCTLETAGENLPYETTYGVASEEISVDELKTIDEEGVVGDEVEFPSRDGLTDPVPYSDPDSECRLSAAEVAGPNGQVNHGQFMKLWNSLYEGSGRGCINRYLAQSDLGKGDQQVKVDEVGPGFMSVADGNTGEVSFSTVVADCEKDRGNGHGNNPGADVTENGKSNGNGNGRGHGNNVDPEADPDAIGGTTADDDDDDGDDGDGRGNGNGHGKGNGRGNN